jgi:hypothetical protein
MKKQKIGFLSVFLAVATFMSCGESKSEGYEDLDVLYKDFVINLKSSEANLKDYCMKITPDKGTVAFMKKNKFSYRGIPEELERQKLAVSIIGEKYYERVLSFKENLKRNNHLENLQYIGREREGEELYNKDLGIYATETFILMRSNSDTIRCKLGEMFKVGGKWKSFTEPKLGW